MIKDPASGVVWAQQAEVLAQLGPDVTPQMLREWARTRGLGKRKVGRIVFYDLHAAIDLEHETRTSGRGRPRRAHLSPGKPDGGVNRLCAWCGGPIPARARRDAVTCSQRCRQARHRVTRYARAGRDVSCLDPGEPSRGDRGLQARRFAYADPPYPGKAFYYQGHPDYGGEVDHGELLSRLSTYDGWALSTSAQALPQVLALAVARGLTVRVAAWIRRARPHTTARYPLNGWEPVIYVPVAAAGPGGTRRVDAFTHSVSPMLTLPTRVIGAKPAAFCRWMFELIGATPADQLDDLYPGSGIVGRTWAEYRR